VTGVQTCALPISAHGDLSTAVEAVRNGAFEYLTKPFELAAAERAIQRAMEKAVGEKEDSPTSDARHWASHKLGPPAFIAAERDPHARLIGSSPAMQEVFKRIAVVAPSDACVHIRGESGTGKELVARAIHRYSRRGEGPFVPVNVASLSPSLAESELFGHVRGAFTGAEQSREGLLEHAHGGTLFIDEVADIPPTLQVKLLRVLEYGEILPVGSSRPVRSDFRVISATHQNLHQKVVCGEFREDLYFRLITFEIELPPLRERAEDVQELARFFLEDIAAGAAPPQVAPETLAALERRPWHGNVRELRNALEHAMILARGGTILPEHLPPPTPPAGDASGTREAMLAAMVRDWTRRQLEGGLHRDDLHRRLLQLVERPLLETVLEHNGGQYLAAARQLGLHRVTLRRKAEQFRKESP
jgi:two-component system nitrogen regulation response regulator GlnG